MLPQMIMDGHTIISIKDKEFKKLASLVYDKFGINLGEHKKALVTGRLNKVIKQLGLASYSAYLDYLEKDKTGHGVSLLVDRISTNHTFFFRENNHFDFMRKTVLPDIAKQAADRPKKELRIWSAGCSSGEEPYTIAMVLKEYLKTDYPAWDTGILATDISTVALGKAKEGVYPHERLGEMSAEVKKRYTRTKQDDMVQIKDDLKKDILFRRFNLMNDTFPFKGRFDIIFCRNVMIYFDKETRDRLVGKFHDFLKDGGYLFVGHSEALDRKVSPFQYIKPAIYRK